MSSALGQFACRFLSTDAGAGVGTSSSSRAMNALLVPVLSLIDPNASGSAFALSWGMFILIYAVNYYWLPVGFWNSADGTFKDQWRAAWFSFIEFYVIVMFILLAVNQRACDARVRAAHAYENMRKGPPPREIQDAVAAVRAKNMGRPESSW